MSELITKIKYYRENLGMSQEELGLIVGVRRETISRLEKGKYNPSLKLAMDIAKIFNVKVEDVFEFVD
ncbi:helix-turn-helix transcriptional regulator [Miniphocaeibacter massiliensis]|uniref:helix-turn-helix transcriptional regulator n=1 Tax=Miniphocaeibacter massiliensis TaxID=2041841 RepID=UPI000C089446|nr:helix-turn-helix transcriptional regulator [Miniphocaeibacter massiliensis]